MTERRPIQFGDGRYTVSECGEVFTDGRPMKPRPNSKGYLRVGLTHQGERQMRTIASMVAEAFIGPRPLGSHIAHLDGDKLNNHFLNLRYCTPAENEADKREHGTTLLGERHHKSKLTLAAVEEILATYKPYTHEFGARALARKFGVWRGSIEDVIHGRTWADARTARAALERNQTDGGEA